METDKIPCIKCDQNLWLKIKPYLVEWGYTIDYIASTWNYHTILVINDCNHIGVCSNQNYNAAFRYNRELIDNIKEFLERAAKIKGFTYKRKDMETNKNSFTKENLQSGMIVELRNGVKYLVINNKERSFLLGINDYYLLDNYNDNLNSQVKDFDIVKVYTHRCTGTLTFILEHNMHKLIWQRKVVITKQEIADKFGVNINDIEINE